MAKDRKSRFANALALLADADSVARYGPWLQTLLVSLVDEGLAPIVVAPPDVPLARDMPGQTIKRCTGPRRAPWPLRRVLAGRVLGELSGEPIRLVIACSGRLAAYGAWLAGKLAVPLAVLVMGEREVDYALDAGGAAACMFAGGEPVSERLRRRLGSAGGVVQTVQLGVHLGERVAAFAREGRTAAIMGVGPLRAANGFDELVAAFAQLNDRHCEAVYFIVGSGPAERSLRRLARDKGLAERLTFIPDLARAETIYPGIDCFVQPFVCRELDLRPLEAMAAGLAVLGRNGGALDLIRDGENGIELADGGEAELTLYLQRLIEQPEIGRHLGAKARDYIQANRLAGVTVQPIVQRVRELALGVASDAAPSEGQPTA